MNRFISIDTAQHQFTVTHGKHGSSIIVDGQDCSSGVISCHVRVSATHAVLNMRINVESFLEGNLYGKALLNDPSTNQGSE
ncbi:hypothetical protein [Loigolactobacillus bifermentans]|uniref:hypothetical protein n=1 Tax=Loigolactobacillus bifermentans TaxID=1607 RepID=UPI0007104A33|nr:hypothetical protein [Loigolactobacillus bifermentans]QGG60118.1 hypothetical protein LB003_06435 [Loigolactobacillus bifermentans]